MTRLRILLSLFFGWLLCLPIEAAATSRLDVTAFGAIGDGVVDDTDAIQAAVQAATSSARAALRARGGHWGDLRSGFRLMATPEVVFPKGHYRVTRPIVVTGPLNLRGEGAPTIEQADAASDLFYFHGTAYHRVEGLSFIGGRTQLRFWTNNLGQAEISIFDCTFTRSGTYAVECQSYTVRKFEGTEQELDETKPWAPYRVEWEADRPRLYPNPTHRISEWFNSTIFVIEGCRFTECAGVADLQCDNATVRRCTVTGGGQSGKAVFHLPSGMTSFTEITGRLGLVEKRSSPYWIEGGGLFFGERLDFDNDGDAGVDFIRVSHKSAPVSVSIGGFGIDVRQSSVRAAGGEYNALCWLSTGNQPAFLSLVGVRETGGQSVESVRWETPPDANSLAALIPPGNAPDFATWFRVCLADNSPNISVTLPEILLPSREEPVPIGIATEAAIPQLAWSARDLQRDAGEVIHATAHGLKPATKQEAGDFLRAAIAEAAAKGNATVLLPAGVYRLSAPLKLPPRIALVAEGRTILMLTEQEKAEAFFNIPGAERVLFKGIIFVGGTDGVRLGAAASAGARVAFEDCTFVEQKGVAIRYLGEDSEPNGGELSIRGGVFACFQAVLSDAAASQIAETWLFNDPHLNRKAFIENRAGRMRLESNLANPVLWDGKRHKRPKTIPEWRWSRDVRWIDNSGSIYALNNRFGGESGGMCNILNFSAEGTVYQRGGSSRFFNGMTRKGMVTFKKQPRLLVLDGIASVPVSVEGSRAFHSSEPEPMRMERIFTSGIFAPTALPTRP